MYEDSWIGICEHMDEPWSDPPNLQFCEECKCHCELGDDGKWHKLAEKRVGQCYEISLESEAVLEEGIYNAEKMDAMLSDLIGEHGRNDCPVCKESPENSVPEMGISLYSTLPIYVTCGNCGVRYCHYIRALKILMKETGYWDNNMGVEK